MNFNSIETFVSESKTLNYVLGNNTIFQYLFALLVFVLSLAVLIVFKQIVVRKLKKIAKHTAGKIDDLIMAMVSAIGWPFYVLIAFYASFYFIKIPLIINKYLPTVLFVLAIYYAAKIVQVLIDFWTQKLAQEKEGKLEVDSSSAKFLRRVLKAILWVVAIILILQNLGYNISTLAATLGIGGIAIAFALQNILEDIFASFSIHFDKPFQIGDFIVIGEEKGTIKSIGIKSTRLESLQGEELIVSNRELTQARIHNFKKMAKRRAFFDIGVAVETPTEKLKKIPDIVKKIIEKIELTEFSRTYFKEFSDFSLVFEVLYFFDSIDFDKYVKAREQINLGIKEAFEKEGIKIAYPTQTIFVKK